MAKIIAPNDQYNGLSASVMFVNGVGETDDPNLIEWFSSRGYTVEEAPKEIKNSEQTKEQIQKALDGLSIEYSAKDTKAVLLEKLAASEKVAPAGDPEAKAEAAFDPIVASAEPVAPATAPADEN